MARDTLSDVLRSVRLRGAVFYYLNYDGEWAAEAPAARDIAAAVLPGAEHVIEYHVITKGSGWAAVVGEQPVRLDTGDIVMFPHGDPHVISSAPGIRPFRFGVDWVFATRDQPKPMAISSRRPHEYTFGAPAADAATNVVCGFIGCDVRPFNPVIASLPRLLRIPRSGDLEWIARLMQQLVAASRSLRPGGAALLDRMSEMIFVDAVGRYVESLPDARSGWLGALRDRHVGRALALMHGDPARDWTVETLASEVALSRSALHERFVELVGQPPMQYLANWRMQVASGMLRDGNATVATIALDVGYESEAAFARAFKRLVGVPPATWRRERRGDGRGDRRGDEARGERGGGSASNGRIIPDVPDSSARRSPDEPAKSTTPPPT